jgi:tetratricopeptide (TPR) repeat protein
LSAEQHFCIGDFQTAIGFYKRAISIAAERRFQNDLALAYELAAMCYMESGDLVSSLEHFQLAHEKYIDWGAEKKGTGSSSGIYE